MISNQFWWVQVPLCAQVLSSAVGAMYLHYKGQKFEPSSTRGLLGSRVNLSPLRRIREELENKKEKRLVSINMW